VLSGYAVEAELATGRLIEVPTKDIDLARRLRAVWRRGRIPSGPAATLLRITLSAAGRPEPPASPSPQPTGKSRAPFSL
jgi:DNA-binding transcriptional LysR family regulator